jgi:hypothetical protein
MEPATFQWPAQLDSNREQIPPFPNSPAVLLSSLSFDIIAIGNRVEMREDELAHRSLLGDLPALARMQVREAWAIGGEGAIKHGHIRIPA